jgi:hypothetical protein
MINNITKNISKNYSPLYFLSSLGAGGLSITFFMYLFFMTTHTTPIPVFNTLLTAFNSGEIVAKIMIIIAILAILFFAIFHFMLLFANISAYQKFKQTEGYTNLKTTNAEVQLMAPPLTFAMSVNVLFVLGAVFIPNLWDIVEYLFPIALTLFAIIGFFAMRIFLEYASRVFLSGGFSHDNNNNLSQMLAVFAFAMIAVGFSASAAMSHNQTTSLIAIILSIFFVTMVIIFASIKLVLGIYHMISQGVDKATSVSMWIIIPITTLVGIAMFRLDMAMVHNFGAIYNKTSTMILLTSTISIQLLFGILGYKIMKNNNYFKDFIYGSDKNAGSYALICPGVALVVMGFFFVHKVIVASGVVLLFSPMYFLLMLPIMYLQFITIKTLFILNKKMLFGS